MKILVTGGAGFVGSHICDELLTQGHEVHVLDDKSAMQDFIPKGVASTTWEPLHKAKKAPRNIEFIVHAAARADVSQNWVKASEREELATSNVDGTQALLEAYRNTPICFLSTCAVYGDAATARETDVCTATSPYAASKLAGEALIQAYAFEKNTPWVVLRLGCVVGSRYHHGHVADFVAQARTHGHLMPKSDGTFAKSYVHAKDVAQAVSMAVRGELVNGIYNCVGGSWAPRDTARQMGPVVETLTEWPVNKLHGWIGDPMAVATNIKLRGNGWLPKESIAGGVREALEGLGWKL